MREMPAPCSRPSPALLGKPIIVHLIIVPYWQTHHVCWLVGIHWGCSSLLIHGENGNEETKTIKIHPAHLDKPLLTVAAARSTRLFVGNEETKNYTHILPRSSYFG